MSVQPSAAAKTERLLNLVIALLSTRMPLSKARIRSAVPQYLSTASDEAFDRMFERDKDELRELGIPLATAVIDPLFDDELGYRIDKREYALPEIAFEPDEVAALTLAGRAWARASGGHATLFRSTEKSGDVFAPLPAAMLSLHQQLKSVFDPHGILNRGRLLEAF